MKYFIIPILTKKPFNFLWIGALLMFAISLIPSTAAFDMTWGDAYYVYSTSLIYGIFALLLIIFWLIYIIAERLLLSGKLTIAHILTTLLPIIIFFTLAKLQWGLSGTTRRYYAISYFNPKPDYIMFAPYLAIIAAFLIGQICFLVNLIGGMVKYAASSNDVHE